jgi:hypothetical protein
MDVKEAIQKRRAFRFLEPVEILIVVIVGHKAETTRPELNDGEL